MCTNHSAPPFTLQNFALMEVINNDYKIPRMDHKFALWKFHISIEFLPQNAKQQYIDIDIQFSQNYHSSTSKM
jgi:hypothetical protein